MTAGLMSFEQQQKRNCKTLVHLGLGHIIKVTFKDEVVAYIYLL
jgi:hypothetical protein